MRLDLAEVVREHQGAQDLPSDVTADSRTAVLMSIVPGLVLQLDA